MTQAHPRNALASVAILLVLVGCGAQHPLSKPEYEQKVRLVYGEVREAFQRTSVEPAALAGRVKAAQAELREAAGELESVVPPVDVREENAALAHGLRDYADDLDGLRRAAARDDLRAVDRLRLGLGSSAAVEQIGEAAEEMRAKGYDLGKLRD